MVGKKEENNELSQYTFDGKKRLNIPQTGIDLTEISSLNWRKTYIFDLYVNPQLQWTDKTEGASYTALKRK